MRVSVRSMCVVVGQSGPGGLGAQHTSFGCFECQCEAGGDLRCRSDPQQQFLLHMPVGT